MQKIFYSFLSIVIFLTIFITVFSVENSNCQIMNNNYYWPTPGFNGISSYFGYRNKPTIGASSYHKGIDILAYQGSGVSVIDEGEIKFAGFDKAGGYMIIVSHPNNVESRYAHLDSDLLVKKGDSVSKGEIIGKVGPKYLANGKLNGATTGVHLHLGVLRNGEFINPLTLF
jgi:murein DD-endopeptidase MepM/ murein hydrolase activator NlpD